MKQQNSAKIIVAVPVSSPETCDEFRVEVDEIICAVMPEPFHGVGLWYEDFSPTTDDEVCELLSKSREKLTEKSAESVGS